MTLKKIESEFSICKLKHLDSFHFSNDFYFLCKTDEELSLVCLTSQVPADASEREDGWRAFRIQGTLDFSLIGILSKLTTLLADQGIGVFAVSTFNTDYILTRKDDFNNALTILKNAGYDII